MRVLSKAANAAIHLAVAAIWLVLCLALAAKGA